MDLDDKIARAKKLFEEREAIDAQIETLMNGGEPPARRGRPRRLTIDNPQAELPNGATEALQ